VTSRRYARAARLVRAGARGSDDERIPNGGRIGNAPVRTGQSRQGCSVQVISASQNLGGGDQETRIAATHPRPPPPKITAAGFFRRFCGSAPGHALKIPALTGPLLASLTTRALAKQEPRARTPPAATGRAAATASGKKPADAEAAPVCHPGSMIPIIRRSWGRRSTRITARVRRSKRAARRAQTFNLRHGLNISGRIPRHAAKAPPERTRAESAAFPPCFWGNLKPGPERRTMVFSGLGRWSSPRSQRWITGL